MISLFSTVPTKELHFLDVQQLAQEITDDAG
jgi:hypothetical protein